MDDIEEKRIVGGIGFKWRGNLLCGVMAEDLLVRVGRSEFDKVVGEKGVRPMAMSGRPSKSWILIDKSIIVRRADMTRWLDLAIGYVATLPAK
jgi:hypothetical protein